MHCVAGALATAGLALLLSEPWVTDRPPGFALALPLQVLGLSPGAAMPLMNMSRREEAGRISSMIYPVPPQHVI